MSDESAHEKDPGEVTELLVRIREGDQAAFDHVFPLVYDELRRVAGYQLRAGQPR